MKKSLHKWFVWLLCLCLIGIVSAAMIGCVDHPDTGSEVPAADGTDNDTSAMDDEGFWTPPVTQELTAAPC